MDDWLQRSDISNTLDGETYLDLHIFDRHHREFVQHGEEYYWQIGKLPMCGLVVIFS